MESLLDKDSSSPNRLQIHSVVWLKIRVLTLKIIYKYQSPILNEQQASYVVPSGESFYTGCTSQACACSFFSPSFGVTPSPSGIKFCHKILETLGYHVVKTRSLYLTWSWNGTGSWRTDRQMDRITI